MTLIQRNPAFFDNTGDDSRLCRAGTDRANALAAAFRDLINLRAHLRRREKRVASSIHRRAAGMRSLPAESNRVLFDAKSSENCPEWKIEIEQDWSLFDVQFDISSGVRQLIARLLHALEIDPSLL